MRLLGELRISEILNSKCVVIEVFNRGGRKGIAKVAEFFSPAVIEKKKEKKKSCFGI